MNSENIYKAASLGRIVLIFSGIMFLFLALSAHQTSEKLQHAKERQILKQLETSLDELVMKTSDDSYVYTHIQELIKVARNTQLAGDAIEKKLSQLKNEYKLPIKAFFYRNASHVFAYNHQTSDLELFSPLIKSMNMTDGNFANAQRQLHQLLLSHFGPGHRLELMKMSKDNLKRYKHLENDQFYYWNEYSDGIGVFFIAESSPDFITRFAAIKPDLSFFGAGNPSQNLWLPPIGLSADQMAAAKIKSQLEGKDSVIASGRLWKFVEDETGNCWSRVADEDTLLKARPLWAKGLFYFASILSFLTIMLYLSAIIGLRTGKKFCEFMDSLSLRFRILGIFSMASIFPVLFTVLIGATSLADRAEIIENAVVSESIAAIEPLEKQYLELLNRKETMSEELRTKLKTTPASEQLFAYYLKKFDLPRLLSRLEVRDGNGMTLFSTDDREVHGVVEAMDIFSRIALKLHAPGRMGGAATKISPAEIVSESVLSTDELGMATIMRQRGKQWIFRMGTFPTTWFWDAYPETSTGPAFMCVATQMQVSFNHEIHKLLSESNTRSDSFPLAIELNYNYCNFNLFPERQIDNRQTLINAAMTSYRTGKVIYREVFIDGQKYWATIKPEKFITTTVFLHLISQSDRLKSLNPLKSKLIAGSIFALIISLLGALLITRLIILPVTDLGNGINAIRDRQSNFRTPIRRNDELGALATAFNNVISELKELEYGRTVQESLLPSQAPTIDGYDLAFFTTSATDLAGDYHDAIKLDDGRIAIILGDVTGHGISAALAMAMAKATVNYTGTDGTQYPAQLMEKLNALFNKELKPRHKFMTLVTVVLEPLTGKLEIDNAGQSYPRFFNAATAVSEDIELPTMPLGAMKKRRGKAAEKFMNHGDAMILFSDGIIECSDESGEMYGYDRFYDHFAELMSKKTPAAQAIAIMMQKLNSFRKSGPYPDDVTLVVLTRK